jgi:hypothetical protein
MSALARHHQSRNILLIERLLVGLYRVQHTDSGVLFVIDYSQITYHIDPLSSGRFWPIPLIDFRQRVFEQAVKPRQVFTAIAGLKFNDPRTNRFRPFFRID